MVALALAVPSVALAHHGHGHHHHRGRAKAHHAKFRVMHIGAGSASTGSPPGAPAPTAPPTPENAGTVASYTGGVLTLTLNDGSTIGGKVTNNTRITCVKATPTASPTGAGGPPTDESSGDDNGQGDDESSDMSQHGDHEWGSGGSQQDGWDGGDDDEAQGAPEPPCDSSALVAGAIVRAAELRIGPTGTEFESVWLVR